MKRIKWHIYERKPIEVTAIKIEQDNIVIKSHHGIMKSKIGDYMIMNSDGTRHICDGKIFNETYDHIEDNIYKKKPIKIKARKLKEDKEIDTPIGKIMAHEGEYLIKGIEGELYPCSKDAFHNTYILVK